MASTAPDEQLQSASATVPAAPGGVSGAPVVFESVRFGTVEAPSESVIEFPFGLIGLGGFRYALIDRNPNSGVLWLHSVEDPALALPVIDPRDFFPSFTLQLSDEDRERVGIDDARIGADAIEGDADRLYVTLRATPDPREATVNLRAPLLVRDGRGFQVLNHAEGASLQAPLFGHA